MPQTLITLRITSRKVDLKSHVRLCDLLYPSVLAGDHQARHPAPGQEGRCQEDLRPDLRGNPWRPYAKRKIVNAMDVVSLKRQGCILYGLATFSDLLLKTKLTFLPLTFSDPTIKNC